jgi:BlaI family transcriptional regulator, penicillinase repressor
MLVKQQKRDIGGLANLSRRERQVLDILYRYRELSAAAIRSKMDDAPSYSAVRALLRVLEDNGQVKHKAEGLRYVYSTVVEREKATGSVLRHLIDTFFGGSPERAVAALLDVSATRLTAEQLENISDLIERAKREGS